MKQMIQGFSDQLREAIQIGNNAKLSSPEKDIHNVLITGMGGSGIGANFVQSLVSNSCPVPITVIKGYSVPSFVGPHTLTIASSYSGNTEETLACFEQSIEQGAKVVVVSSGGKMIEKAKELDLDYIQLPSGWTSPRACLGFSLVQQLFILKAMGLIGGELLNNVSAAIDLIEKEQEDIRQRAEYVAMYLEGKTPVIYCMDSIEPVGMRFRQQLNENAKVLCWHHVVPEMNHNELVGWFDQRPDIAVVILRNRDDYARNQVRLDISKEIIGDRSSTLIELFSKGNSLMERCLYLVHLVDWVSLYLAEIRGVDPIQIKVIDYLKEELSKV